MPLDAPVIWVFTSGDDRLTTSVERYDSRDEALAAVGVSK
jgi:hypothetical protein